jgi:glucan phosphoethanolaminetransferase (alkaline phosphatase superfamily)
MGLEKIMGLYVKEIYSSGTMTKTSLPALLNRLYYPGSTNQILSMENNLFYLYIRSWRIAW